MTGDVAPSERQPGILILTHGAVGNEMIRSAEMIMGPLEGVTALSLMPGVGADSFAEEVKCRVETMPEGSLILTDIFGGTPANTAALVSQTKEIVAISGLSLSMLIEAVSSRSALRGEGLAQAVLEAGRSGCRNITAEIREVQLGETIT